MAKYTAEERRWIVEFRKRNPNSDYTDERIVEGKRLMRQALGEINVKRKKLGL